MNRLKSEYLDVAREAAQKAGDFLFSRFGDIKELQLKETNHWSINEDTESNKIYEDYLASHSPEAGLYTEEGKRDKNHELTWVVDPLEGTSNYRSGIPFFATQICLLEHNKPIVAVINAPCLKLNFSACAGEGAYVNGKKMHIGNKSLNESMTAIDKGHDNLTAAKLIEIFAGKTRTIRWFGALGLNMAFVANGGIDLFINEGSDLYDFAAGILMVREAGGNTVNFKGDDWNTEESQIIAGNENIVREAVDIISKNYI